MSEKEVDLCEYAERVNNPMYDYKCRVMYECRYKLPEKSEVTYCPRREIGRVRQEKYGCVSNKEWRAIRKASGKLKGTGE